MSGLLNYPRAGFSNPRPIVPSVDYGRRLTVPMAFESTAGWEHRPPQPGAPTGGRSPIPAGWQPPAIDRSGPANGGGGGGTSLVDAIGTGLGLLSTGSSLINATTGLTGVSTTGLVKQLASYLGITEAAASQIISLSPELSAAIIGAPATEAGAGGITMSLGSNVGNTTMLPAAGVDAAATGAGEGLTVYGSDVAGGLLEGGATGAEAVAGGGAAAGAGAAEAGALAAYGGDAAVNAGLLGGSLYAGEGAALGASTGALGTDLAGMAGLGAGGAAAFAAALLPAIMGYSSQPDVSSRGGRVDIGADENGMAAISGASGKQWDMNSAQGQTQAELTRLNGWMAANGLRLRPDWSWGQEVGDGETRADMNNLWDRLGFQAGDAFQGGTGQAAAAIAPGRLYQGWNDFAQAAGGGPAGVAAHGEGYQLTANDATNVWGDQPIAMFGGSGGPVSDRWTDLAQRTANIGGSILGFGDNEDMSSRQGLPQGFLGAFRDGRDPRLLPGALTGEQYDRAVMGQGAPLDIWSLAGPQATSWNSPDPNGTQATLRQNQAAEDEQRRQAMAMQAMFGGATA